MIAVIQPEDRSDSKSGGGYRAKLMAMSGRSHRLSPGLLVYV